MSKLFSYIFLKKAYNNGMADSPKIKEPKKRLPYRLLHSFIDGVLVPLSVFVLRVFIAIFILYFAGSYNDFLDKNQIFILATTYFLGVVSCILTLAVASFSLYFYLSRKEKRYLWRCLEFVLFFVLSLIVLFFSGVIVLLAHGQ